MAKIFKQMCGSKGRLKTDVIERQGDHRAVLEKEWGLIGRNLKRFGG